jgi:hypothetical protein
MQVPGGVARTWLGVDAAGGRWFAGAVRGWRSTGRGSCAAFFFLTTDGGASKSPEGGVGGMRLSYQELFGRLLLFWISASQPSKDRSNNPGFLADVVKGIFHIKKYGLYHASKDLHTH